MISVNFLSYREGKRRRCSLCNDTATIAKLAIFHEDGIICGDLLLCESCSEVLEEALLYGSTVQEVALSP